MNEMIDISKLKTWDKPHKVYIPSKYGVFVNRVDLEQLLETAHNSDYEKSCETCVYGVDGCQHEPPCITGAGKPHYEKLNFA